MSDGGNRTCRRQAASAISRAWLIGTNRPVSVPLPVTKALEVFLELVDFRPRSRKMSGQVVLGGRIPPQGLDHHGVDGVEHDRRGKTRKPVKAVSLASLNRSSAWVVLIRTALQPTTTLTQSTPPVPSSLCVQSLIVHASRFIPIRD